MDDPYAVLAALVEHFEIYQTRNGWLKQIVKRAESVVAAHRAGQRTEHRPDLIDRDGDRWVWHEGYSWTQMLGALPDTREYVEANYGPVTEAGAAESEEETDG